MARRIDIYKRITLFIIFIALSGFYCYGADITDDVAADTIPDGFKCPMEWRIGGRVSPAAVIGTCGFLTGDNVQNKNIPLSLAGSVRAGFTFNPESKQGMIYRGVYQGLGVSVTSFFAHDLMGTPVSAYVYQGGPIVHFRKNLWFGYEWNFGAAFGWKHNNSEIKENNYPVSTPLTAHMGVAFKLHYQVADRWELTLGLEGTHYSNGNTSWPNKGVNTLGGSLGFAYILTPQNDDAGMSEKIMEEADRRRWVYDVMAFGSWRRREMKINDEKELVPGKYGVAGLQFAPLYKFNRWIGIGPALDMKWDESGGMKAYQNPGDLTVRYEKATFRRQVSVGVSAHAELTLPIFSLNGALGYDLLSPVKEERFYQMMTIKAFVACNVYVNIGYRIGGFKDPQNLMLGVGVRL